MVQSTCSDCSGPAREMTEATLKKGNSVREPGEGLCNGCSSSRLLLVRLMDKVPDNLVDIQAARMPRPGKVKR